MRQEAEGESGLKADAQETIAVRLTSNKWTKEDRLKNFRLMPPAFRLSKLLNLAVKNLKFLFKLKAFLRFT
jgi:hypothetical protein